MADGPPLGISASPVPVVWIVAAAGVPQCQLRPELGPHNGRWDEVHRVLLAAKRRALEVEHFALVLLVEAVEQQVHVGVAAVLVQRPQLAGVSVVDECAGLECFRQWARDAPVSSDCGAAVAAALDRLHPRAAHASCAVFASPDDAALAGTGCTPATASATAPTHEGVDLCVKVFGGPCSWAAHVEAARLRQLAALLQLRYGRAVAQVSLGPTRLRLSQCLLCADGVRAAAAPTRVASVPRVAFELDLRPLPLEPAARLVHHFVVEVLWPERRRDTPRHHVCVRWAGGAGCVTARDVEALRGGDRVRERRAQQGSKVTGVTWAALGPEWLRLLQLERDAAPNRSIRRHCAFAGDAEELERFVAGVVRWQLAAWGAE